MAFPLALTTTDSIFWRNPYNLDSFSGSKIYKLTQLIAVPAMCGENLLSAPL